MHEAVNTRGGKFFDSGHCLVFTPLGRRSRVTPHASMSFIRFQAFYFGFEEIAEMGKGLTGGSGFGFFIQERVNFNIIYHYISSYIMMISYCILYHLRYLIYHVARRHMIYHCFIFFCAACGMWYHVVSIMSAFFYMIHAT